MDAVPVIFQMLLHRLPCLLRVMRRNSVRNCTMCLDRFLQQSAMGHCDQHIHAPVDHRNDLRHNNIFACLRNCHMKSDILFQMRRILTDQTLDAIAKVVDLADISSVALRAACSAIHGSITILISSRSNPSFCWSCS